MRISGFYKRSPEERLSIVMDKAGLDDKEAAMLKNGGSLPLDRADRLIENVIGVAHLPFAVATNFRINGKEMLIPMVVEEASVVAAACRAAKQTLPEGFSASADSSVMIGQVQFVKVPDMGQAVKNIEDNKKEIKKAADEFMLPHQRYGCGVEGFEFKRLMGDRGEMLLFNFFINVSDAQGANMINTTLEGVSLVLQKLTGGEPRLRIVSNLATKRKAKASAVWKKDVVGEDLIEGVLDGYDLAKNDIYRCSTHNKGIMNGIDAVALATGNDWRSIEAGAHSYAAMGGYHPLTHYEKNEKGDLVGSIELPLAAATVGPAMSASPTAGIALKIMGIRKSQELAMAMACAGLANNFAALSALAREGIQKGHMKLHARNVALYVGASEDEADEVAKKLTSEKNFSVDFAQKVLEELRSGK